MISTIWTATCWCTCTSQFQGFLTKFRSEPCCTAGSDTYSHPSGFPSDAGVTNAVASNSLLASIPALFSDVALWWYGNLQFRRNHRMIIIVASNRTINAAHSADIHFFTITRSLNGVRTFHVVWRVRVECNEAFGLVIDCILYNRSWERRATNYERHHTFYQYQSIIFHLLHGNSKRVNDNRETTRQKSPWPYSERN